MPQFVDDLHVAGALQASADPTKVTNTLQKAIGQSVDMQQYIDTDGTTVKGKVDANFIATFQAVVAAGLTGATSAARYVGATTSGAPASGTFVTGDWVISKADAKVYACTAGGTPGTWTSASAGSSPLLSCTQYAPGTNAHYSTTVATPTAIDSTNLTTSSFVAPASGKVLVRLTGLGRSSLTSYWGLVDHGTSTLRGVLAAPLWQVSNSLQTVAVAILVTGLTSGTSYQFDWAWAGKDTSTTSELFVQGVTSSSGTPVAAPAVMEVWSA